MRVRLKIQRKFSAEKVFLFIAIFCVSSFALLEYMSISVPLFSVVKNPLLYIGGFCILTQIKTLVRSFLKKKYIYVWVLLLVFCLFLSLSAYANRNPDIGESPIRGIIRMILYLVELQALMIWVSEKGHSRFLINLLFYYVLILVAATDLFLFTGFVTFMDGTHEAYLVGTKFIVSYLHMDLLTLWFLKGNNRTTIKNIPKPALIVSAILLIAVSVRVQCMTGVLGCVVLFVCFMMIDKTSRRGLSVLNSPVVLLGALAVNMIFPFISELVVAIPFVRYFVVEVLGRSENLTGRIEIFEIFGDRMSGHWLFGFGLGNENLAARELFGYANAQNAILQWILRAGLLNTVALIALMVIIFRYRVIKQQFRRTMPLVILIYVYIFLGTVEITFGMSFIMWVFLIFALINDEQAQEEVIPKQRKFTWARLRFK